MARKSKKTISGRRGRQEERRLKAGELFDQGLSRAAVAGQLKVTWRSAHEWFKAWRAGGPEKLHSRGKPGRAPKFSEAHRRRLEELLKEGALAHGFDNALWTLPRIRRIITEKLELTCSLSETWRLLRSMNWSPQLPERRARERQPEKIRQWKEERWPQVAAAAKAEGRTVVFVDESGLSQKPARKSSWAPEKQTPQLVFNFSWKKLSVIGGISLQEVYFQLHESSIKSAEVCQFVDHLCGQIKGPVLIVWDGLRAHWSKAVKEHIAAKNGRVTLEQLPAYAPELNPIEYLWGYVKGNDLANFCARDLAELGCKAREALGAGKVKDHLRAFWVQSELALDQL